MPDSLILTLVTGETSLSRWKTAEPSWSDSDFGNDYWTARLATTEAV